MKLNEDETLAYRHTVYRRLFGEFVMESLNERSNTSHWFVASSTWVMADEVKCLAKNIYFEARNQSIQGMYAVADVTLNRVKDSRWPSTVCEVVKQHEEESGCASLVGIVMD